MISFVSLLFNEITLFEGTVTKVCIKASNDVRTLEIEDLNCYMPIFEEIECLSEKAELNLNKTVVKKIILDNQKIKGKKIFKIKESVKNLIVVRLDVAESLLRREFKGICLERLKLDN